MRLALAVLGLLVAVPAQAGGLGLIVTGGVHTEKLWYHSDSIQTDEGPLKLSDPRDYAKFEQVQTLPHMGTGLEFILGDRDDRITGNFRFYYMMDAPQIDPATNSPEVASEHVVAAYRDKARHVGVGVVGINIGILGDPSGFQAGITGHLGSGFLTRDHTEFLIADVGPTASYRFTRQMQVFADVGYQMRFRKGWSNGMHVVSGVRYMFD